MERWWGPRGFSTTVQEWDLQPGGPMKYFMTAPDGTQYPCGGVCIEVVEPERLVSKAILRDVSRDCQHAYAYRKCRRNIAPPSHGRGIRYGTCGNAARGHGARQ